VFALPDFLTNKETMRIFARFSPAAVIRLHECVIDV
jgi:hypothetical protein